MSGLRRAKLSLSFLVLSVALSACGNDRAILKKNGVSLRRAILAERGATLLIRPGDFIFESTTAKFVVAGINHPREDRGALVGTSLNGVEASGVWSRPLVRIAKKWVPVQLTSLRIVERKHPALRVIGQARLGAFSIIVDREYELSKDRLSVTTSLRPSKDSLPLLGLSHAEQVRWGGATPLVPGSRVGSSSLSSHSVSWLAAEVGELSVLYGFDQPMGVSATLERHGESTFLEHTKVFQKTSDESNTSPQQTQSRMWVVLSEQGIGHAVRSFGWGRQKHFPEAVAQLPYRPEGTKVTLSKGGNVWVTGKPDKSGRVILPAPFSTQTFRAVASAFSHASSLPEFVRPSEQSIAARLSIPRGGRLSVSILDEANNPMPGRIRVLGMEGTKHPDFGPKYRASGAKQTVATVTGRIDVGLAAGIYKLLVSRGPEWSLHEERIEVTQTRSPNVTARLLHLVDPRRWVGGDFHVHAAPSPDSQVSISDRVISLAAEGIGFAVPTDHNAVSSYSDAIDELGLKDFGTVDGVEVTTWEPAFGHFNVFPFTRDVTAEGYGAPPHSQQKPGPMFAHLRSLSPGAVIQVNHPRLEPGIGYFDALHVDPVTREADKGYSEDFDVLEIWNGFDLARPDVQERVFVEWLSMLGMGQRIVASGNSDSHAVRYQWAGYPRTYVWSNKGAEPASVMESLSAGRVFVSNGPFLEVTIDGKGPGELVTSDDGKRGRVVTARVVVRAPPWIDVTLVDLYVGTTMVKTLVAEPPKPARKKKRRAKKKEQPVLPPIVRIDEEVTLQVGDVDTFLVARVSGEKTMTDFFGRANIKPAAFSNPIWIDSDRDGSVVWLKKEESTTADAGVSDADFDTADKATGSDSSIGQPDAAELP